MKGLLTDTCTVYPKSSANVYGEITYGSGTSYDCRVLYQTTRYVDDKGVIQSAPLKVFFDGDVSISVGDRVVIDSTNYIVVEVNKPKNSNGVHHTEVKLKNG